MGEEKRNCFTNYEIFLVVEYQTYIVKLLMVRHLLLLPVTKLILYVYLSIKIHWAKISLWIIPASWIYAVWLALGLINWCIDTLNPCEESFILGYNVGFRIANIQILHIDHFRCMAANQPKKTIKKLYS